jgi:hypothetical protein
MEKAVVIRSDVQKKKNYADYRDDLRFDFWYSCAYCNLCESEAMGIGFEIDHYLPTEHFQQLVSDYNNLFWSCEKCNNYKSDYFPDKEQIDKGNYIIRADEDDQSNHMYLENYIMKQKTGTGNFNIEILILNRKMLQRIRKIREKISDAVEFIAFGVPTLKKVKLDFFKKPRQRILFLKILDDMKDKLDSLFTEDFNNLFRQFAKSPLLDKDPDHKKNVKNRREFLKNQKVINNDSSLFHKGKIKK